MNKNDLHISDFSMLLLKKLYLIEGIAISSLAKRSNENDYYKNMKEIQELCAGSPTSIEERFRKMTEGHERVGEVK